MKFSSKTHLNRFWVSTKQTVCMSSCFCCYPFPYPPPHITVRECSMLINQVLVKFHFVIYDWFISLSEHV